MSEVKKMDNELLVRVYKVGCGDCIFIRIPDKDRPYHVLIDCGNYFGDKPAELKHAMESIKAFLNDPEIPEAQQGRLDLLVATHQHWDHIKGFESSSDIFKELKIDRIWLSVGMKEGHPQARQFNAMQAHVQKAINRFLSEPGLRLSPSLNAMLMMGLSTPAATDMIRDTLPAHHGIEPVYVYRDFEDDLDEEQKQKYLIHFKDPTIRLVVLAPETEIDSSYVSNAYGMVEELDAGERLVTNFIPEADRIELPKNISARQFRLLKNNLNYAALLAASKSNHVVNNTSVVLLLEWQGNRLLFPGDAEQESWTKIWENAKPELSKAVNFLKVSHHGSWNGTPINLEDPAHSINQILKSILPKSNSDSAKAVVSTLEGRIKAKKYPVPLNDLMKELAERICNTVVYSVDVGKEPQRTDKDENGDFIPITLRPRSAPS